VSKKALGPQLSRRFPLLNWRTHLQICVFPMALSLRVFGHFLCSVNLCNIPSMI